MSKDKREREQGYSKNKVRAGIFIVALLFIGYLTYPIWSTYMPNTVVDPNQGLKLTGTVNYANHTAVDSQTVMFVDKTTRTTAYTASISGGSYTTNRGPLNGGTYTMYISITGCQLFIQDVEIPIAAEYDHEAYTIDPAVVYTSAASNGWTALLTGGSVANAFTGGGSAATSNYTASAGNAVTFDLKTTITTNYAQLFRQYTDPFDEDSNGDDIAVKPVLWVQIGAATGIYDTAGSNTVNDWSAGSVTYFCMDISTVMASSSLDVSIYNEISLVCSSAGTYTFDAYIIDGSNFDYLTTAKAQVAHPNSGETVTAHHIVDAYIVVS